MTNDLAFIKSVTEFGDDSNEGEGLDSVSIKVVSNGYLVTYEYEDAGTIEEVFQTKSDLLTALKMVL